LTATRSNPPTTRHVVSTVLPFGNFPSACRWRHTGSCQYILPLPSCGPSCFVET
jgi:hypothetical protein